MSDSQSENGKKSRETSEFFGSGTMLSQPRCRETVDDDTTNGGRVHKEQPVEKGGDSNAGEMSDKLPMRAKDAFGEIMGNMLNMLKFLGRCFGLFPKGVSSQSQEAVLQRTAQDLSSAFPNQFPTDALVQAGHGMDRGLGNERFSVKHPPTILKPRPSGPPPQHPRPRARR